MKQITQSFFHFNVCFTTIQQHQITYIGYKDDLEEVDRNPEVYSVCNQFRKLRLSKNTYAACGDKFDLSEHFHKLLVVQENLYPRNAIVQSDLMLEPLENFMEKTSKSTTCWRA